MNDVDQLVDGLDDAFGDRNGDGGRKKTNHRQHHCHDHGCHRDNAMNFRFYLGEILTKATQGKEHNHANNDVVKELERSLRLLNKQPTDETTVVISRYDKGNNI